MQEEKKKKRGYVRGWYLQRIVTSCPVALDITSEMSLYNHVLKSVLGKFASNVIDNE